MGQIYDVLIIGSGVVGSAIARELSRYDLKIGVLEKNHDVINETSGRNSAVIHAGFAYETDTLKARQNERNIPTAKKLSEFCLIFYVGAAEWRRANAIR